jgi:type II secretory pathway pseudopilin PulG
MRGGMIDFSSWSSILTTVASLLLITLLMVGIRLVFMQTIQKRRERENRQINERLKTLMAAYKTLGGSFTGQLAVSPCICVRCTLPDAGRKPWQMPPKRKTAAAKTVRTSRP